MGGKQLGPDPARVAAELLGSMAISVQACSGGSGTAHKVQRQPACRCAWRSRSPSPPSPGRFSWR